MRPVLSIQITRLIYLELLLASMYKLAIQNCDRWLLGAAMTADLFYLVSTATVVGG